MICPICKEKLIVDYEDYLEGTMAEFVGHCKECKYEYDFAYGNYIERIGEQEWMGYWNDTLEVCQRREAEIKAAIKSRG